MNHRLTFLTLAAATCAALAAPAAIAKEKKTGEEQLAELLEGRVAGEPQSCINSMGTTQHLKIIDGTALVYGRGKTIYVNRTRDPDDIDDNDVLVTRRHSPGICSLDIVTKVDRSSGFFAGSVFLEDFIPYTRVEEEEDS